MFKHKLKALGYLEWDKVDGNNTEHFRKVVVWLENQRIRHYTIENRDDLRNIKSDKWPEVFDRYCESVKCPISSNALDKLEWLIGYAVRLTYMDSLTCKAENPKSMTIKNTDSGKTTVVSPIILNLLDRLVVNSNEFQNFVNTIAKLLKVPQHPDHLYTLQACSQLICDKLSSGSFVNSEAIIAESTPIQDIKCGISLGDAVLDDAAKGLTLLYVQDLRDLQTKINEVIVRAQILTADPKTNTKLGKVGK